MDDIKFPPEWITTGYGRGQDGQWVELGHVPGVTATNQLPPTLGLHEVAALLNRLERMVDCA